jgi:hypothetical protein
MLEPYTLTAKERERLRGFISAQGEVFKFSTDPKTASLIAALGIHQEVGTLNDDLARFVFEKDGITLVPRTALKSELVKLGSRFGVRIWAMGRTEIVVRLPGFKALLHPEHSFNADGSTREIVIFPETIAQIIALENVEAVLVKAWVLNTVFGGLGAGAQYYEVKLWDIENNDTLLFSRITEKRLVPFLSTHDLAVHISGLKGKEWDEIEKDAARVRKSLEIYFLGVKKPSVGALILPYLTGVVLDDLAQALVYRSPGHLAVLNELLRVLDARELAPGLGGRLVTFPEKFNAIVELARSSDVDQIERVVQDKVRGLMDEIRVSNVAL